MHTATLLASLLLLLPSATLAADGAVHVRGQLLCNNKPYANQKIELYEKDWTWDSRLVENRTDEKGKFEMTASIHEWRYFTPQPYIYFGNYCNIKNQIGNIQCADAIKIYVPPYFVAKGHIPKSIFNIDRVEMNGLTTEKKGLEEFAYTFFTQQDCRDVPRIR